MSAGRSARLRETTGRGAHPGRAGVPVMTAAEKAEQDVTGRPNS
jgi:hypothetical protein